MNVYDFDGTIYDGDSTVDFYFYALKHRPAVVRHIPGQLWGFLLYGMKKSDKTELKERFFSFLSGIDAEKLVNSFWDRNQGKIYDWYLKQKKADDIIISASPEFLLAPVCRRLGLRFLIASRVDAETGKFSGKNCHGPEKVRRLAEQYQISHIDRFYSDSQSDLPLAGIAEQAFMVEKGTPHRWEL